MDRTVQFLNAVEVTLAVELEAMTLVPMLLTSPVELALDVACWIGVMSEGEFVGNLEVANWTGVMIKGELACSAREVKLPTAMVSALQEAVNARRGAALLGASEEVRLEAVQCRQLVVINF